MNFIKIITLDEILGVLSEFLRKFSKNGTNNE